MKRNLALLLAMTTSAFAQIPTVVEKAAPQLSSAVKAAGGPAKPSPTTVKVNTTPAQKPAVVSVQPVAAKTHATPFSKPSPAPQGKPIAVTPATAKPAVVAVPVAAHSTTGVAAKPAPASTSKTGKSAGKPAGPVPAGPVKVATKGTKKAKPEAKAASKSGTTVAVRDSKAGADDKKAAPKSIHAVGRRDPFISPVVNLGAIGSGCSSGKRCLAIDQIALRGIVRSDNGMIAVVVNAMDKAYFLRENDPVFNGYVVKITGDSIVFKETLHDKLGKPLTRDVTKTINRPVA
jgi:hypothetical protein